MNAANPQTHPFKKTKKRFQVLGIDREKALKYFFGGNASLAIVILSLICIFLAKEAIEFFPSHHRGLQLYRQSGQEFVDLIERESSKHKKLTGSLAKAYFSEINESSKREQDLLVAYEELTEKIKRETKRETLLFNTTFENWLDLQFEIEDAEEGDGFDVAAAKLQADELSTRLEAQRQALRDRKQSELGEIAISDLESSAVLDQVEYDKLSQAIISADPDAEDYPDYVLELNRIIDEKKAIAEGEHEALFSQKEAFRAAGRPLDELLNELRNHARTTKERGINATTLKKGKEALLLGAERAKDPARRAEFLADAEAIQVENVPFDELNALLYEKRAAHHELAREMAAKVSDIGSQIVAQGGTPAAIKNLAEFRSNLPELKALLNETPAEMDSWRHDQPFPFFRSVVAFFVGKDWITNSSWHDFYGIIPLFTGSIMISIIALIVTVPFSVGAAIYVNQIAGWREQNFIKPVIEFIQAIPSIVLGFFGIAVLGTTLRDVSQLEWLSWVPGFPMQGRLNILNAGLLLAFMAIPTVFTLAEDALNNVPRSFTEGSLALGATKLQTILRIVVPGALSGIIAAILLGFGRIIGETMVVLLVAGGSISIPDFSAGIGVVTQPVHTMTGIIAQETGEVDQGSIHYRALFMLGMVLFSISLMINYAAQKIVHKYQLAR